jgi:hypothetical protein
MNFFFNAPDAGEFGLEVYRSREAVQTRTREEGERIFGGGN